MLTPVLSVLYLHGFASSPQSRKARFLQERFGERGIQFNAPDLEAGDFFHLTISRQLEVVREAARGAERLMIVGSSLGGYLASLYAAEHSGVDQLVLLAPAFGFHDLWIKRLGPEEIRNWRDSGRLSVFHYGTGGQADLSYGFLEDAEKYPPYPNSRVPTLIFHGTHDDLVPVANSTRFVDEHREARLVKLDSGHELTDVLDEIWAGMEDVLPAA
jgi:pimeloyl-ACP methyl ester carboxylesterase